MEEIRNTSVNRNEKGKLKRTAINEPPYIENESSQMCLGTEERRKEMP
jgi:hypothetical protein